MDSLTQLALGAGVAEYLGGKKLGHKAALRGAIFGTLPDLDIFINPLIYSNSIDTMIAHRGITHSLFFSIVAAPILGYLVARIYKTPKDRAIRSWIAFFAITTHRMLDSMTGYGTQILQPFSDTVFSLESIFIVDPLYTIPLLTCLIRALRSKIGSAHRKKIIGWGLTISTIYLVRSLGVKYHAHHLFQWSLSEQQIQTHELHTSPEAFTTFLRRGRAESEDAWYLGRRSIFDKHQDIIRRKVEKNSTLLAPYLDHVMTQKVLKRRSHNVVARPGKNEQEVVMYPIQFGSRFGWVKDYEEVFMFGYHLQQTSQGNNIEAMQGRTSFPNDWKHLLRTRIIGRTVSTGHQ